VVASAPGCYAPTPHLNGTALMQSPQSRWYRISGRALEGLLYPYAAIRSPNSTDRSRALQFSVSRSGVTPDGRVHGYRRIRRTGPSCRLESNRVSSMFGPVNGPTDRPPASLTPTLGQRVVGSLPTSGAYASSAFISSACQLPSPVRRQGL